MTIDIQTISTAIEREYQRVRGLQTNFDRSSLPKIQFYMEEKPPSMWARLRQKDFHSILHKVFNIPVIGTFINTLFLLARLPHHLHKIRSEIFELKMELRKFEGQFLGNQREFTTQARQRFEKLEQLVKRLEQ